VTDPRSRRGVPDRWLLPPPPREPHLAARWQDATFDERRRLARLRRADLPERPEQDVEMAVGLARARLHTSWRLLAGAPVVGWLMLMTVWGFGRSTYPEQEQAWLLAGALLGGLVWLLAAIHAARRLRRARALVAEAEAGTGTAAADHAEGSSPEARDET
jgi:hypothetical protein